MPYLNLPHGELYYTDRRVENPIYPPLVLIHGAGGSHLDWPATLRKLPHARVIALDLPGHGRSQSLPAHAAVSDYVEDVLTLLEALHIERAILAGHSMGGGIVQHIALSAPRHTAGLILLGTGSKLPIDPSLPQRALSEPDATSRWIVERAWHPSAPAEWKALALTRLSTTPPATLRADFLACQRFDTRSRLGEITVPTLVIGAAEDRMVRAAFSQTLAEHIPQAHLVIFEHAGHMFPLECPEQLADEITSWLNSAIKEAP